MSNQWDDLRFNAAEGEWAARPLGDMRRCLADLLAERDALAAKVERLREALTQITHLHLPDSGDDRRPTCLTCYPSDSRWPCTTRMEADDALAASTEGDDRG